jgi:hypothetical protein
MQKRLVRMSPLYVLAHRLPRRRAICCARRADGHSVRWVLPDEHPAFFSCARAMGTAAGRKSARNESSGPVGVVSMSQGGAQ